MSNKSDKNRDGTRATTTFLAAAAAALRLARRPLTLGEIMSIAIKEGILVTSGKTPNRSMSAVLYLEVRQNPDSQFVRIAKPGPTRAQRGSVRWKLKPRRGRVERR